MIGLVKTDARENVTLRDRVYGDLRHALMTGRFLPGQKMPIRALAAALGTSLTPVREALRRLITEGVLEGQSNRSVRVPLMTRTKILELRELRVTLESIAAARAAEIITRDEVANLRVLALEIMAARTRGDPVLLVDQRMLCRRRLERHRAGADARRRAALGARPRGAALDVCGEQDPGRGGSAPRSARAHAPRGGRPLP